jgi:uncharacterized protein (TIGR03000 family)
MFHNGYSIGGTLLIALVTAVVTPASAKAQHGGGGHGGGFHGGGGGFGGFHGGGHFGGYGGFNRGYSHFGYSPRYGYHNYGYRPYYGGYGYSYPSYGYYPYSNGYSPDYSGYYPSDSYDGSYGTVAPSAPDGSDPSLSPTSWQAAPAQPDTRAHITLTVPSDAVVSFDGATTGATGKVREFSSPPLESGRRYAYEVRARSLSRKSACGCTCGACPG